jgi:hypothetical protein
LQEGPKQEHELYEAMKAPVDGLRGSELDRQLTALYKMGKIRWKQGRIVPAQA